MLCRRATFNYLFLFSVFLTLLFSFSSDFSVSAVATPSTLTISSTTHNLVLSVMPSSSGTFSSSANNTISITTDNFTGYTLKVASDETTSLVNEYDDEIESITSSIDAATFASGASYINKWGYKPNQYVTTNNNIDTVVQNTNFLPAPSLAGDVIGKTSAANSSTDTYTISFGTKIGYGITPGTYTYAYNIIAVANTIVYNVTYDDNTTDTVTNMPSPNPQGSNISGGTPAEDSYITLSETVPIRNEKKFAGWCDVATTTDPQTNDDVCSGTLYSPGDDLPVDQTAAPNITLYAVWVDTLFPIVWNHLGACEFHGNTPSNITGSECQDYWDSMFIDTGIPLYSQANASKDFEIHFTIVSYNPSIQQGNDSQQTFVNDKVSSTATSSTIASGEAPGLVVRRSGNAIEFNSKINNDQVRPTVSASVVTSGGGDVSIFRLNHKIYYSVNNGPLVLLQDITGYDQYFGLTTWFGGYPSDGCTGDNVVCEDAKRFIEATLSNMYIRLGEYSDDDIHEITFNSNGASPAITAQYLIEDGNSITTLPDAPLYTDHIFQGWFTAQSGGTQVTAATIPTVSTVYYAHWLSTVALANITNDNITLDPQDTETIIVSNSAELEPYTFSSNNLSVATVDENTGEITAVGPGSTTITMTGTISHETRTINILVNGNTFTVYFDPQGGSAVSPVSVGAGTSINPLPTTTKTGHNFMGWYTGTNGTGTQLTTSTVFDANTPTQYYAYWVEATFVCKMATVRHYETCERTSNGCRKNNLYAHDAKIYYGTIPNSETISPGFAYTCDVNANNIFDEEDERFYYIATNGDNAVMYYYRNIRNVTENYAPAVADLPDSTVWTNSNLVAQADNKVARFMNYSEATAICGSNGAGLTNHGCEYLLERSNFATENEQDGIWMTKISDATNGGRRIHTASLGLGTVNPNLGGSNNAPRPVIEVPLDLVQKWSPVVEHEITFDPQNNGQSSASTITVVDGNAIGSLMPSDPPYSNHLFQGWFDVSTGTSVTSATVPSGDMTVYAEWLGTVALAQPPTNPISVVEGGTTTIQAANASGVEEFTCSSSDSSIATVDSNTCVVSGVVEGTVTISITGKTSNTTNNNFVTVNVLDPSSVFRITFDPRNGENTFYRDVLAGNAIGTLMPQDPSYTGYVFTRWYDTSNNNTVNSATEPASNMSVYAEWKLDVTQAIISNNDFTMTAGGSITILVSNASDLESYSFSSLNSNIATVDANGVITGVSAGTTYIRMTGVRSNLYIDLEVEVTPAPVTTWEVTFNANGGTTPSPASTYYIDDGEMVGTLPTTSRTNYRFFGWYKDDSTFYEEVYPNEVIDSDTTFYARWIEDTSSFPIEFAEINECEFNGNAVISGTYCTQDKTKKFVDSGVSLFSTTNYQKDFEIGFTIIELASPQPVNQATLVNSKYENSNVNYPGFVMRSLSTGPNYQLTARFSNGEPTATSNNGASLRRVKIVRQGGVIKYSFNDGNLVSWFDVNDNTQRFDTRVWFGAASTADNETPQRYLNGKLTDMYVKMGAPTEYLINFDINDGFTNDPTSKTIAVNDPVGAFPTVTPPNENYTLAGWFDESVSPAVEVTSSTVPNGNKTYVAHWSYVSSDTPVVFDVSNEATRDYQTLINTYASSPINIGVFHEASPINNSVWGDTSELSETAFWTGLRNSFIENECNVTSYGDSYATSVNSVNGQAWTSGTVNCSKPDVYDTKIGAALNVYLNDSQGAQVTYAKAENGIIHNMIPGQTYYWEKSDDSSVHGYVTATSVNGRRWIDAGSVRNVRDLGGLPVSYTDGNNQTVTGTLAYGRLIRGERLWTSATNATEILNLGINKEYDVGNPSEGYSSDVKLSSSPNATYQWDQVIHYNFDYNTGDEENASSNYMMAWTAVTDIMRDITDANSPKNIFFHCRVGADRTGTVAYILEGLLGVPDEARYEEYELTHLSGLYDRTRYYKQKNTNQVKFVYMMDYLATTQDIYNWYMSNPNADPNLIQAFRTAMTVVSSGNGANSGQQSNNTPAQQMSMMNTNNSSENNSVLNDSSYDATQSGDSQSGYVAPLGVTTTTKSYSSPSDSSNYIGLTVSTGLIAAATIATIAGSSAIIYSATNKE